MRTIDAVYGKPIRLSKTGTNDTTTVRFNVETWLDAYPDCIITLVHRRPTEEFGLPVVVLPIENGKALWLVSNADTYYAGTGDLELVMNRGTDNAKSATYNTEITMSVARQDVEPPEPYQGFVDYVTQKASEATLAKNDAVSAKENAESAAESAESYKDTAVASSEIAEQAKDDAISAKDDAISAKEDAVEASETAISAKNDAVSAKDDAVSAKNDAVTAKNDAVSAKTAAETAQTGAETAQTAAETAQAAAEAAADSIEESAEQIELNRQGIVSLNQAIDTLPTSETGSKWANKEELHTELVDQFVGEVDRMFSTGLPQESTMGRMITQLSLGNGLLNDLYLGMEVS